MPLTQTGRSERRDRARSASALVPDGLHDRAAVEKAEIRVERIETPILFVSGDDDQMWPASEMTAALVRRCARARRSGDRHLSFAEAGHIIRPPLVPTTVTWTEGLYSGGTPEGSAGASVGAWREILRFLDDHLGARGSTR